MQHNSQIGKLLLMNKLAVVPCTSPSITEVSWAPPLMKLAPTEADVGVPQVGVPRWPVCVVAARNGSGRRGHSKLLEDVSEYSSFFTVVSAA